MLDVTIQAPPSDRTAATGAAPRSLLDAGERLAAVMRHGSLSFAATAERLASYDSQPYPMTYVFSSNHVIDFLRALTATRQARDDGLPTPEAEAPEARPSYGPPLREAG